MIRSENNKRGHTNLQMTTENEISVFLDKTGKLYAHDLKMNVKTALAKKPDFAGTLTNDFSDWLSTDQNEHTLSRLLMMSFIVNKGLVLLTDNEEEGSHIGSSLCEKQVEELAKKRMQRDLVQNSSFLAEIENMQEESGHPSESSATLIDKSFEEELESLTLS